MSRFRPRDEYEALVYVIDRLAEQHPSVDEAAIVDIMAEELEAFSGARIRDYIPVLVERQTRYRLRALTELSSVA
ncbi:MULTISPECIES: three-helix bundle dimerization domain-containing protein [unclassified Microbacterium]|uniref:three-helix bundle dimerization domain-containing protein n=1 Tax=unclassified Microbacterium TaxID=2609290 RepID=UPI00374720E6